MEMTTQTIPVVNVDEAREQAYDSGYERFSDLSGEETEDFDLEGFRGGATYANHVLPTLRCLSGHGDRGHGTHTEQQEVAVIEQHQEDDIPAEADVIESQHLLDDVLEAWEQGVYDVVEGKDRYESIEF